jgi:hypothetical protein
LKFQDEIPSNSSQIQTLETSLIFHLKSISNLEKVIPFFKPFTTIFYLKKFKQGKPTF